QGHDAVVPPGTTPRATLTADPVEQLPADLIGPTVQGLRPDRLPIAGRGPAVAWRAGERLERTPVGPRVRADLRSRCHRRWSLPGESLPRRAASLHSTTKNGGGYRTNLDDGVVYQQDDPALISPARYSRASFTCSWTCSIPRWW